jgi:hypothetical protein
MTRALLDCVLLAGAVYLLSFLALGCSSVEPVAPRLSDEHTDTTPGTPPHEPLTYEFGAKFGPPVGRVVHAQGQWQAYNLKYQALLPQSAQPASELSFISIADTIRPWQPALIGAHMEALGQAGRVPSIDISLRGNQPTPAELAQLEDKLYAVDDEIAHSGKYDARLMDLVVLVKQYNRPVMVRIGGEFSGWWNGYHPYDYPKAFRKIVNMFRSQAADNAAFIWCYEPAAPGDFDEKNAQGEYKWFPGDDVVDWFSIDLFSSADLSGAVAGHGGASPFARTIKFLDMAVAHHKPVVIAESAPSHYDLGNPAEAMKAWNEWFTPYFALISSRSEIKWFHYINYDWTKAAYYASTGWKNNDLTVDAALSSLYTGEITKPKYLHAGELHLLKDWPK